MHPSTLRAMAQALDDIMGELMDDIDGRGSG
jgi:hypothetical protein